MRRLLLTLIAVAALAGGFAPPAGAHPMSTSAVLLDVQSDRVEGEVQLPIDRLAIGVKRELTPTSVLTGDRDFLSSYTSQHIAAISDSGQQWVVRLGPGAVRTIDRTPHLVYPLTLRPPGGEVTNFDLRYDVIVEQLVTHKAIATVRYDFENGVLKTDDAQTLGIFDYETKSIAVPAGEGSWLQGFAATAGVGIEHIGEGADHLLFLLMLLIPAPLIAVGGRWRTGSSTQRSLLRIVHVVTAFAVGHSLTLALAALGVLDLPSRPVETLIALSIGVSAVHALRPLTSRGEVLIAGGFGLVHGLAFASLIGDLGLDRGSLVTTLLGFNLGIEVTQLLVVALVMPSLVVLARTTIYPAFRTGVALAGLVFSVSWMLERAAVTASDPFDGLQTWLVEHPFPIAAAVALMALVALRAAPRSSMTAAQPAVR